VNIQAEVSLYPLRTKDIATIINTFCQSLAQANLKVESGPMSTHISGDVGIIFESLENAFIYSAEEGEVVMTVKMSNACPERKSV